MGKSCIETPIINHYPPTIMVKLSAIVCTYNRASSLGPTLDSLARQSAEPALWEIVVVDNNSTDNTEDVVAKLSEENPSLSVLYVKEEKQGLSHARNRGIEESKGGYILFLDDDIIADPALVGAYIEFFDLHPFAQACGGVVEALYEEGRPVWATYYTDRMLAGVVDLGPRVNKFRGGKYPTGANFAVRRKAFDRFGTFNPDLGRTGETPLGGEEKDLFDRFRKEDEDIYFLHEAKIKHIVPGWKTSEEYFDKLTTLIGRSERTRTLGISQKEFYKRLAAEVIKWDGAFVLLLLHTITFHPGRGWRLIRMRINVTTGLLGL